MAQNSTNANSDQVHLQVRPTHFLGLKTLFRSFSMMICLMKPRGSCPALAMCWLARLVELNVANKVWFRGLCSFFSAFWRRWTWTASVQPKPHSLRFTMRPFMTCLILHQQSGSMFSRGQDHKSASMFLAWLQWTVLQLLSWCMPCSRVCLADTHMVTLPAESHLELMQFSQWRFLSRARLANSFLLIWLGQNA